MQNITKYIIISILAGLLCACTSQMPPAQNANYRLSWHARQQQLSNINHWQIRGLVSMRSSQKNFNAFLNWNQQNSNYGIYLSGPLDVGAIKIYGRPGKFILQTSQTKKFVAKTPEQLMQQRLGWHLPISSLYYWIRGIPVPSVHAMKYFDNYHRLTELDQQGWQIHYTRYTNLSNVSLPGLIIMHYPGITVKIVINKWGGVVPRSRDQVLNFVN